MMREVVVAACHLAVERSALLAGAGIGAILKKIGRHESKQRTVVAVDGGLYDHYRLYRESLHDSMTEMLGSEVADNVIIEHSNDRTAIGAALLSASHSQ
ncbi:hexokinase-1-like protein [Cinnamomum micranthum f. kanehirae]|uniref:Phosphotransferase n=1 Tax=Cinnamomum micranthum f. kanehirae TaxID=337451 RepID=A0A443N6A9_9MAGN|nr:hexokinase-1-like protein [Cinnamomum micranthum f. kanehirae]